MNVKLKYNQYAMKYIFLFLTFFVFANALAGLRPVSLRCEYQNNPLGIDVPKPRLSWQFTLSGRNQLQTSYEIIVSDNLKDIQSANGLMWTSGKITSNQNTQIEYDGKELKSFTLYYWRVRVYDEKGSASTWSEPATFETSMLHQSDWKASWIGDGSKQFERDEDFYQDDKMPLFRKLFNTKKKVESARLYVAGAGYYEAYLNGKKISNQMLDAGWTNYSKQVLYSVHDITTLMKTGNNVAGIMLGNGWFNPLPLRLFSRFNLRMRVPSRHKIPERGLRALGDLEGQYLLLEFLIVH